MRRNYKLQGEICANCAAKIEDKVRKLDGVNDAKVNFMMLRFTLDASDESFDDALTQSLRIFEDIEPDCTVVV